MSKRADQNFWGCFWNSSFTHQKNKQKKNAKKVPEPHAMWLMLVCHHHRSVWTSSAKTEGKRCAIRIILGNFLPKNKLAKRLKRATPLNPAKPNTLRSSCEISIFQTSSLSMPSGGYFSPFVSFPHRRTALSITLQITPQLWPWAKTIQLHVRVSACGGGGHGRGREVRELGEVL